MGKYTREPAETPRGLRVSIHQCDYLGKRGDRVGDSRGKLVPNCGRRG